MHKILRFKLWYALTITLQVKILKLQILYLEIIAHAVLHEGYVCQNTEINFHTLA